jgi:type II secretory pathway component PulF
MMYAIVWIALLMLLVRDYGRALLVFVIVVGPVALIAGVVAALVTRRATQQDALLSVLAIAAERGMPLAPGVEAFAELCSGGFRLRARGLSYLLASGVPLPEALANVPGVLPRRSVVLACVGWSEGKLGPALRDAIAAETTRRTYRAAFLPKLAYLCGLLVFMQLVGGFVMFFITPKFEAIFRDFGVSLPPATLLVIQASHFLASNWLLPPLILLELIVLFYLPFAYFGLIRWRPPGADWFLRRRDTAAVLRSLAVTVDAGKPLTDGLGLLAEFYPVPRVRRGLVRARVLAENGVPWIDALARRGLIRRGDAAVLEAAQRAGNLAWALRTLADAHERRLGYRLQALSQLLLPAVVILAGGVVGLFAVGYFLPLIHLIRTLAS